MEILKQRILKDGNVKEGNVLKVDSFLNHQMDIRLLDEIGKEFRRRFDGEGVNKILTIEASGIGIAVAVAQHFDYAPVVFAKKSKSKNLDGELYTSKVTSFTRGTTFDVQVSKKYLNPGDRVLIIDDFLAKGQALMGLLDIVAQSGALLLAAASSSRKVSRKAVRCCVKRESVWNRWQSSTILRMVTLCSAISRLSLHPISRFGFVRNCGFSTRRSLALAHSLVEAKKFVVSRGNAFSRLSQRAKHPQTI